jgi:hypothetical protein
MNNVQEMMMDRRGAIVVGLVIAVCALPACAKKHSPQDSTETGNPPVIDADRVALVVRDDEVHVVGEKGAVDPGGATIQVTNLVSDKRASGRAAGDGSFDVKAPGDINDAFSVQASNAGGDSKPLFVTKGGAVEGDGKSGALSCEQQTQLSKVQTHAAIMAADATCTRDDDCVDVETTTVCWSTCSWEAVSPAGKTLIESVVASINGGLCSGYRDASCETGLRFCPNDPLPHVMSCVQGHCMREGGTGDDGADDAGSGGALSCADRGNMAHAQLSRATADADRSCSGDGDCKVAPSDTDCFGSCTFEVVSTKGEMQVQDAITAINTGLCAGYADDGCGFSEPSCKPPPTPVCKQGQCIGMLDAAMCAASANLAQTRFDQASASIERTCTQQSDCSYAPLPSCANPNCNVTLVSKASADQVQALVDQINQDVCAPAEAGGCSYEPTGPVCFPPATRCVQGVCQ